MAKKNIGLDYEINIELARELIEKKQPGFGKLSLKEMADMLGCGHQILSDLKGNRKKTSDSVGLVMKMAELAGCKVEDLVSKKKEDAEA